MAEMAELVFVVECPLCGKEQKCSVEYDMGYIESGHEIKGRAMCFAAGDGCGESFDYDMKITFTAIAST